MKSTLKPKELVREGRSMKRAAEKSPTMRKALALCIVEGLALSRAAESPDFWIGLAARLLKGKYGEGKSQESRR